LVLGSAALIAALLQSVLVGTLARRQVESDIGGRLLDLSAHVTGILDRSMFERYREIEILATLAPFRDPATPRAELRAMLETLQRSYREYAWIGVTDAEGTVIASTGQLLEGERVAERPWYQGAQAGTFVGDVHEALLLAQLLPNPSDEPLRFVDVATPLYDAQGDYIGVLGAHLSWAWAHEVRTSVIAPVQDVRAVEIIITRADGEVLLGPATLTETRLALPSVARAQRGQSGVQVERWSDGVAYLVGVQPTRGYRDYPGLDWIVLVRQPLPVAFAQAQALQNQLVLAMIGLATAMAVLAIITIRRATQPLRRLARAADQLRSGAHRVDLPPVTNADEVARLTGSLQHLVTDLLRPERELAEANAQLRAELTARTSAEREARRRLAQVQALRRIDIAITTTPDIAEVLRVCVAQVIAQLGVDIAVITNYDAARHELRWGVDAGLRVSLDPTFVMSAEGTTAGRVIAAGRRVALSDIDLKYVDANLRQMMEAEGVVSFYGTPLLANGVVQGVLEIFHRTALEPDQEWLALFDILAGQIAIAMAHARLLTSLTAANEALMQAYDTTIEGWSRALDLRDKETEGHSQRVTALTLRLAETLGITGEALIHVQRGALLHDIGKMGVPDQILLKPGPLDDAEWAIMRQHPIYAYDLLAPIGYLRPALDIPHFHHEKWDGSGYPHGLRGEQIPLAARIFAVIDVWDALTNDRPYRSAWPVAKAREHIRSASGRHFDPAVVAAFERVIDET
jgi:HD-GYP domain-containing protein (c-di-GMP phosphodiesterase class II)